MDEVISKFSRLLWPSSWVGRVFLLTIVWGCILSVVTALEARREAGAPRNRPVQVTNAGYVSSTECRACHPGNYASWHASYHRTMTQVAKPENVIPVLNGFEGTLDGYLFHVERKGDRFYSKRKKAEAPADAWESERQIVMTTGSHNMQFFWLETGQGRTLEHFPFGYFVQEKTWAPLYDTLMSPPEFHELQAQVGKDYIGDWNGGCIDCHTTQGRSRFVRDGVFDSEVSEFGISCESCHGQGRTHIDEQRNPLRRYWAHLTKAGDPKMANPGKMKGPESSLACGQCHSVWSFESVAASQRWNREGTKFAPGQKELPERFVVRPGSPDHTEEKKALLAANPHFFEDSFWSDGMVRVVGREYNGVSNSPCFKGGEFSCLSCHDLHPKNVDPAVLKDWAPSQMSTDGRTDQACLQCHQAIGKNLSAHTHHAPTSSASHCYECHMPHTGFGLMRAVRSHQVSSPNVLESVKVGRPNACNLCHLDKTLAWTAEQLNNWYGHPVPELSREDRSIAAGVKWIVKGDAAQRALVAWHMGWEPAQKASGREWFTPYLAVTLVDSYSAVRFVVGKSLRTLPGFEQFNFHYTAERPAIKAIAGEAYQQWLRQQAANAVLFPPSVHLDAEGGLEVETYSRLLDERDQRPVFLVE